MRLSGCIQKIAVFRALQLGDMLCVVPAIRSLRNAYPKAKITLLGLPWAESFVTRFDRYFDRFIHFPGYEGLPEQTYDEKAFSAFVVAMKKEKFDLVLQMQGNGTVVNDLMFLLGARHVAGFYNKESYLASDLFVEYPNYGSEVLRHLALMEHLGVETKGAELEFPLHDADYLNLESLCLPIFEKRYVCIHPGSRGAWRQWPPQYFAALADHCVERGYTVVITGTAEEQDITSELIKCMHHPVVDLTGKTTLGTVAVLIKNASLLIANCTGVSHIASAVNTHAVIISMDGEPERWMSSQTGNQRMIDCKDRPSFNKVYLEMLSLIKKLRRSPAEVR